MGQGSSIGQQGATGSMGITGSPGNTGPIGVTGAIGSQGIPGSIGPIGPIGLTGLTGSQGIPGIIGPIGLSGLTGSQGIPGSIGPIGPIGLTGLTGSQGIPGSIGPIGPIGLTGDIGSQGIPGNIGPIGQTGLIGQTGPIGPIGLTGQQGQTGPSQSLAAYTPTVNLSKYATQANPNINLTNNWQNTANVNTSEISNDISGFKSLMLVGNSSGGGGVRSVSLWDKLTVNGDEIVTGGLTIGSWKFFQDSDGNLALQKSGAGNTPNSGYITFSADGNIFLNRSTGRGWIADNIGSLNTNTIKVNDNIHLYSQGGQEWLRGTTNYGAATTNVSSDNWGQWNVSRF